MATSRLMRAYCDLLMATNRRLISGMLTAADSFDLKMSFAIQTHRCVCGVGVCE